MAFLPLLSGTLGSREKLRKNRSIHVPQKISLYCKMHMVYCVPWYGTRALKLDAVQTDQCPELKIFINSQGEEKLATNVEVVIQQLVV